MRWLTLFSPLLIGCNMAVTIPADRLPDYAANQPVLSNEGIMVSRADGGRLELLPFEGSCLSEVQSGPREDGGTVSVVAPTDRVVCAHHRVAEVRQLRVGSLVEVEGNDHTVIAQARAISGVELRGAELGSAPHGRATRMRSPGAVAAGVVLMLLGSGGGLSMFIAAGMHDPSGFIDLTRPALIGGGVLALGAGLGGGIPLVAIGAQQIRSPASEQLEPRFRPTGIGLEWQ